jgi:hypothetical protein
VDSDFLFESFHQIQICQIAGLPKTQVLASGVRGMGSMFSTPAGSIVPIPICLLKTQPLRSVHHIAAKRTEFQKESRCGKCPH